VVCASEIEKREEEYREIACGWSNNALVWAGFAITEFVLETTLFTAFRVQTSFLLELTILLSVMGAVLFGFSSTFCTIASQPAHTLSRVKDKRTGKPAANPRQILVERAERLFIAGCGLQTSWICVFLVFLEMYWVLAIVVVVNALLYMYVMPLAPIVGKDKPKQN
jgi:NADH:ubiquinone oxidoreductase subunit 3 (subunit A)